LIGDATAKKRKKLNKKKKIEKKSRSFLGEFKF